jgi:hypothetical protein
MKKLLLAMAILLFAVCFSVVAFADGEVPENYKETESSYVIYTDAQYQEVILGVYNETLPNKTIVLGCDISVTLDLVMEKPCDISLDLNGYTYTNNYKVVKRGDFDLRHKDAIIRIRNGNMICNFCVFVFQTSESVASEDTNQGQVYLENVNITSLEEVIYNYGGYGGVLSFKNCNLDVTSSQYSILGGGNCSKTGILYQIEGGSYDGLNIYCAREGSYARDCTVYNRDLKIDSWHSHGQNGTDVSVEIRNVNVTDGNVYLNDARVDPVLYDCTYRSIDMTGGSQSMVVYTSASCQRAATKTTYTSTESSFTVDEQYSIDNPAIPHSATDDNDCTTDVLCSMCQAVVVYPKLFAEHDKHTSAIDYKNGFGAQGEMLVSCKNCSAIKESAVAPAILTPLGYSYSKKGTGIDGGYEVNADALLAYETVTGKSLTFGIIVLNPDYQTESTFFTGKALTCASKSVTVELKTKDYSYFNFSISGFTAATENLDLIISAYAYTEDDASDICFIQKQYDDGKGPVAEMFEKNDGALYSVTLAGVRENDLDAINKENE